MRASMVSLLLVALVFGSGCRQEPLTEYLFIHVDEINTHALAALPGVEYRLSAKFDEHGQKLQVANQDLMGPGGAPAVVYHKAEALGVVFGDRVIVCGRLPAAIYLGSPFSWPGLVVEPDGRCETGEAVCNQERLLLDLTIKSFTAHGEAFLSYGGEDFVLAPGERWLGACYRSQDGLKTVQPGPDWEEKLTAAYREDRPITKLQITNYGLWPWNGVTVGSVDAAA
ncbi:MAG TPA: hypothetical protein GXZ96_03655 [Firmicutes bacterium]|nr:hypothetical protein [Bacillota bacterium]